MKNYNRPINYENIKETLLNDTLGRNRFLFHFIDLLQNTTETSCSIALDGQWGSGKSFFIQQAKLLLDSMNPFLQTSGFETDIEQIGNIYANRKNAVSEPILTVYYDAWKNDNFDDPILSLIYSIANSIPIKSELVQGKRNIKITDILGRIIDALHFQVTMPIKENNLTVDIDGQRLTNILEAFKKEKKFGEIDGEFKLRQDINDFFHSYLRKRQIGLLFLSMNLIDVVLYLP